MNATLWLTLLLGGALTFSLRWCLIALVDAVELPDTVKAGLRYVPVAVFAAIIGPMVLVVDDHAVFLAGNARLWAALVAAVVAWKTRNVLYTIIAGMIALWLLHFLAVHL